MNHIANNEPHPHKNYQLEKPKAWSKPNFLASFLVQSSAITLESCAPARPEVA
jgi:hypothetical protein